MDGPVGQGGGDGGLEGVAVWGVDPGGKKGDVRVVRVQEGAEAEGRVEGVDDAGAVAEERDGGEGEVGD